MFFGKRKKNVMVVDDEFGIRDTSEAILESWGFKVVTAMNQEMPILLLELKPAIQMFQVM